MKTPLYNTELLERMLRIGNHDTLTWLASISGLARFVLQKADNLTDEQRECVKSIHDVAARCHRMSITKMSVITNMTADIFYEPAEPIVLTEVIADVIAALNANARYGSPPVILEIHVASCLPSVRANRRRLEYCFHTIMSELRHTQQSNPAHLHLTDQPAAIEISMHPLDIISMEHREMLTLLLADNGGRDIIWDETTLRFILPSD